LRQDNSRFAENIHENHFRYIIKKDAPLTSLRLDKFVSAVGSRTATPGGGSVSAAVAAMVRIE